MIFIVIDNAEYPEAKVLGVYREMPLAVAKYEECLDPGDPYGPGVSIVTWDIVNNLEAGRS